MEAGFVPKFETCIEECNQDEGCMVVKVIMTEINTSICHLFCIVSGKYILCS